jgi:hypothetical protein
MPQDPAPFPADELRAAAAHDDARSEVDALHAELTSGTPDPARIAGHVERLRGWDNLVGHLERWYLDPRTQLFIQDLNATGL